MRDVNKLIASSFKICGWVLAIVNIIAFLQNLNGPSHTWPSEKLQLGIYYALEGLTGLLLIATGYLVEIRNLLAATPNTRTGD